MANNNAEKTGEHNSDKKSETAAKNADDLHQQMSDLRRDTEQRLDRMARQMRDYGSGMARGTQSQIREHPLSSVGGAFALGVAVGCLIASMGGMSRR